MIVVVDASGIVQILLGLPKRDRFNDVLQRATLVLAPDLYVSELTNVFWKYFSAKILSKEECLANIQDGIAYIDNFVSARSIWQDVFYSGIENNHSIYDMIYMEVAKINGATLITNDKTLSEICKNNDVNVFI